MRVEWTIGGRFSGIGNQRLAKLAVAARPRFYPQLPESDRMKTFTAGQTVWTWPRTQNNAVEED